MNPQSPTVTAQVAGLASLPMKDLLALWDEHFPLRPRQIGRAHV